MIAAPRQQIHAIPQWLYSFAAACVFTLVIFLLLAMIHRDRAPALPAGKSAGVRLQTVEANEEPASAETKLENPDFSNFLPTEPVVSISPIKTDAPAIDVSVDLASMLEWRYGYENLGASQQMGAFGISSFADIDQAVQSIFIPPKQFPKSLIDIGITEGRVVVNIMIDENGKVEVKNVLSATHPSLIPIVVDGMNRAIYSVPMREGRPTKVFVNQAVIFKADLSRVMKNKTPASL